MAPEQLGLVALLTLCAALLIALLVRQGREARESRLAWQEQQKQLNDFANALLDEMEAQRQDSAATLQQLSSQMMGMLTQMAQNQTGAMESMGRQTALSLGQLDTRMEQLRQATASSLSTLMKENDRQLTEMRRTVDEKLSESLEKRLNDSFALVSRRLEQVYKGLGEMQTLAQGVGDLKKVLTNVKTRGSWGEMQLGALLEQLLAPAQYERNAAVVPGSQERVEFAIRLPGQSEETVYLPIDSKFPQEDYLRLMDRRDHGDAPGAEEARKALRVRMQTEAKRIAAKYVQPPHTTDFAILFLPVEGLYAEVTQDAGLLETIQREQRVVVAGPSTLAALLNALQMGFRTLTIQRRSSEVWQLLGAVKNDFAKFADTLDKTRQRLQQATESIDTAFTRTRSIQRRLGAIELPEGDEPPFPES